MTKEQIEELIKDNRLTLFGGAILLQNADLAAKVDELQHDLEKSQEDAQQWFNDYDKLLQRYETLEEKYLSLRRIHE